MKLVTNKDFTKEYKNDVWRGFALGEVISLIAALGMMVLTMYLVYKWTGIPLATCVYISVPVAAPIVAIGFLKYQEMSILEWLREMWYMKKTERLSYDAGSHPGAYQFSMYSKKHFGITDKETGRQSTLNRQGRKRG